MLIQKLVFFEGIETNAVICFTLFYGTSTNIICVTFTNSQQEPGKYWALGFTFTRRVILRQRPIQDHQKHLRCRALKQ